MQFVFLSNYHMDSKVLLNLVFIYVINKFHKFCLKFTFFQLENSFQIAQHSFSLNNLHVPIQLGIC